LAAVAFINLSIKSGLTLLKIWDALRTTVF
jgi:hypothetical protein